MTKKIILATSNKGKSQEIQRYLADLDLQIITQDQFNVSVIEETGLSFIENAILKARHAAAATGLPAIGDDSGLVVPALNGEPGIHSARYAGAKANDQANIQKLLIQLANCSERQAHFYCVLVYLHHPQDPEPIICQGRWFGEILRAPQGDRGFGYDPIFYVPSLGCAAAELDLTEKNRISHRGQALAQLREGLTKLFEII